MLISQEQMMSALETCYNAALNGISGKSKDCESMACEYLEKYGTVEKAAKKFIDNQVSKCAASGFVTGFGGILTMPVTLPANVASVLYVQLRMIAVIAYMGGHDVRSDQVQTLVYLCLIGSSFAEMGRATGVNIANKVTINMLKKLPGEICTKINQKVGFRLVTKFGEKGAINLVKVVPVAGAAVGATLDFASTKVIANKAYKTFILNEID